MKGVINIMGLAMVVLIMSSCSEKGKPNYQYFPNMYISVGYETYGSYAIFENDQEAMLPVEGTVPRGWMPYRYSNTNEGYQLAKDSLKNILPITAVNLDKGKALYGIYCAICHGDKGNGKGTLVQREKILGVPSYDDQGRAITQGSIYHVMYYGINSMGSYAAQTNEEERWQIVQYVQKLQASLEGKVFPLAKEKEVAEVEVVAENQKVEVSHASGH